MRVLCGSFKAAVCVALSCLCLVLGGKATLLAAETTVPDRQQVLLDAVVAAQKKLADAVQAKKPADAQAAAQDLENALAAYNAEPTPAEIATKSSDLGAWLRTHKASSATDPVSTALVNLAQDIAAYRGDPTPTEIAARSSDLGAWLRSHKPSAGTDPVSTALGTLVQDIATYRGLGSDTFIATASVELTAWIGKTNWSVDSKVNDLMPLAEAVIQKVRLFNPDAAGTSFKTMALAITGTDGVTGKPTEFRPPLERSVYATQLQLAWSPLNDQVRTNFPVVWFPAQANAIKALLNSDDASANQLRRTQLLNNTEAMKSAAAAKDAIILLQGGYRPQIHIIDALYGDLPTGRYSKRVCNATRTMTTKCERQDSCHLEDGYKTALCGYDPIPAADERTRAVAVQYACFTGGDAVWDRLASHPLEDPFEYTDLTDSRNPATGFAILRGTTMELRCPFDAKAPTMSK